MRLVIRVLVSDLVMTLVLGLANLGRSLSIWLELQVIVMSVLGFLESNAFRRNSLPGVLRCRYCLVFVTDLIALSLCPLNFGSAMAVQVHFFLVEPRVLVVLYLVLRKVLTHLRALQDEARLRTSHHEFDYHLS